MKKIIFISAILIVSMTKTQAAYDGHGSGSVSAEVLKSFAPKSIDPALSAKLEYLLKLRSPGLGMPSNNGRTITCTWALGQVAQVYEFDLFGNPESRSKQITTEAQPVSLVDITPDEKFSVLMIDNDGTEDPGIYLLDRKTNEKTKIIHEPKVQASVQHITKDSRFLYYKANSLADPKTFTLYRYEIATGKTDTLFSQLGYWGIADFDEADGRMIIQLSRTNKIYDNLIYNPASKNLMPLVGQNEDQDYQVLFAKNSAEYLVSTSKFGDFVRLYLWNGKDQNDRNNFKAITEDKPFEIESFKLDPNKKMLFVSMNDQGYSRVLIFDATTLKSLASPQFQDADHVTAGNFSANGRFQTFGAISFNSPSSRFLMDWKTGNLNTWFQPDLSKIDISKMTRDTLEYYPARDGTMIPMFVRRPKDCDTRECPVLVHFHGGPEGQSVPGYSIMIQSLVDEGFIVIQPNVRGSEGYGRKWLDSDNGPKRLDIITDIEDASIFVKKEWAKNGRSPKVGIFGGSYGGYSTLIGMTMFAGAFDAGVSIVGIANLKTFLQNTHHARRYLREPEYGYLGKDDDALEKLSPVTYLDRVRAPLMIIQGANDPRVPVGEAILMYDALKEKGIPSELIIFADEGHGASKTSNKVLEMGYMILFFKAHLLAPQK